MAKTSSIEKNNRRKRMVEAQAPKRKRLKALAKDRKKTPEERFAAQLKLAEMPRNGSKVRVAMNDPIGDMLTRIRNAQMRRRPKVATPASNLRARVLDVLTDEGYIRGYTRVEMKGEHPQFEIELKYYNGQPAIKEIERVSKPGRRVYSPVKDIPTVANGLGVAILSTPKGVMSDSKAREANVGGEVICNIF